MHEFISRCKDSFQNIYTKNHKTTFSVSEVIIKIKKVSLMFTLQVFFSHKLLVLQYLHRCSSIFRHNILHQISNMLNFPVKKMTLLLFVILSLYVLYITMMSFDALLISTLYGKGLAGLSWKEIQKKDFNHTIKFYKHNAFSIQDSQEGSQKCMIPHLDPFHPDILRYLSYQWADIKLSCSIKRHGRISDGHLVLEIKDVTDAWLYYILRETDTNIRLSKRESLIPIGKSQENIFYRLLALKQPQDLSLRIPLKKDFVVFEYRKNSRVYQEYYAVPILNSTDEADVLKHDGDIVETSKKVEKKDQLNIILLLIDSTSHANAYRYLHETYSYLKGDMDSTVLNGHTIVGDGTVDQVTAMLANGVEKHLPEARRGMANTDFVDRWPLIFKDLHRKGYKTLFSEDHNSLSAFNYRLTGFDKQPAVKYLRPFWMFAEKTISDEFMCSFEYGMQYLKDFFDAYEDYNKFGFISSSIIHDDMNKLPVIDRDLMSFYRFLSLKKHAMNTVVFLFGDHGSRYGEFRKTIHGKLEERLPLMAISMPKKFRKKFPTEFSNLKKNAKILTSHFDIYATLKQLIDNQKTPENDATYIGRSLFTDISTFNRTCAEAGVADAWCPCLNYEVVPLTDITVLGIAHKAVGYINKLNSVSEIPREKCAILTLDKIIRAGRRVPNVKVQQFEKTVADNAEIFKPKYDSSLTLNRFSYELVFSVQPSNGEYEITSDVSIKYDTVEITIYDAFSRLNKYGHQPSCIQKDFPHLRKYCFCKEYMTRK